MKRRAGLLLVAAALVFACASPYAASEATPPALDDAGSSHPDGAPAADADTDTDAPSCTPGDAADSVGRIHAQRVLTPIVVDGRLDEWSCVDRFAFTTGQRIVGLAAGQAVADIAVQWDEQHLYFAAIVSTTDPPGSAPRLQNFQNDNLAVVVAGPSPSQTYTASDHDIVVDSLGQVADYEVAARTSVAGIVASVGNSAGADAGVSPFFVELRVDAAVVGRTAFAIGDTVRVNFGIYDAPDVASHHRVWFVDPLVCKVSGSCSVNGTSEPFCDPSCTGEVVLR